MRTASADISAKIVLPTPRAARPPGPRSGAWCAHASEPNRSVPRALPGRPALAPVTQTRSRGRRITFWVGVALVAAGWGARLRRLAVLGHQLGRAARSSDEVTDVAAGAVDRGRHAGCSRKHVAEGRGLGAGPDPEVRQRRTSSRCSRVSAPDVLARASGTSPSSADPGEVGNYALAAHRVTHGEPLRRMPELRPGDEVVVETVDATLHLRARHRPARSWSVPFTGVWVLDAAAEEPRRRRPAAARSDPASG